MFRLGRDYLQRARTLEQRIPVGFTVRPPTLSGAGLLPRSSRTDGLGSAAAAAQGADTLVSADRWRNGVAESSRTIRHTASPATNDPIKLGQPGYRLSAQGSLLLLGQLD